MRMHALMRQEHPLEDRLDALMVMEMAIPTPRSLGRLHKVLTPSWPIQRNGPIKTTISFGDNPAGERPDACPTVRGTSFLDRFGCEDSDGDGISNVDDAWTLEQGADACPLTFGNSSADRIGCVDTDGDNYSDPTPEYRAKDGADAYPNDPTRWILEPEEAKGGLGLTLLSWQAEALRCRSSWPLVEC